MFRPRTAHSSHVNRRRFLGLGITAIAAASASRQAWAEPAGSAEPLLRKVADEILRQTTRKLIDWSTGARFENSDALQPKPEISIESPFNAWFYQTWMTTDGMRRAAKALNEPRYEQFGEQNLDFIFRHMPYFTSQNTAKMKAAPVGDGVLSPIGFYFQINSLWQTGLAPLVLERYHETKDPRYEPFLKRVDKFLEQNPRFDDGAFYRKGKGMMTDDPYMSVPYMLRKWKFTGEDRYLETAIAQVLGTHTRLLDPQTNLLRHLWDLKAQAPAAEFWGRGNGWMVLAQAELLSFMPAEHPRRKDVLNRFQQHMDGLRRCQHQDGGWHQVLNEPKSWIETSGTCMFVYGFSLGLREGWLDASFAETVKRGWSAMGTKVTETGEILDTCGSTDTGNLAYYMNRPRIKNDLHGYGSFMLAAAETARMEKSLSR